jgi:hypothetical protein
MPKRNDPWRRLYDSIEVVPDPKHVCIPPVTEADLEAVESALAFRLPKSYRAFMMQFGPGDLVGHWLLPLIPKQTRPRETIIEVSNQYRQVMQRDPPEELPDSTWHSGVVCFASCGPHMSVWNSTDKTSKGCEPRVYDLCWEEQKEPVVVADSFWKYVAFVEEGSRHSWNPFRHGEGGLYFRPATLVGKNRS